MTVNKSGVELQKAVSDVSEFRRITKVLFGRGVVIAGFVVSGSTYYYRYFCCTDCAI